MHTERSASWQTASKHSNKKSIISSSVQKLTKIVVTCIQGRELSTVLNQVNCGLQPSKESLGRRLSIFPKIFVASDQQSLFLGTEWVYYRKDLALKFLFLKTIGKSLKGLQ